jgi:hypothetical protein
LLLPSLLRLLIASLLILQRWHVRQFLRAASIFNRLQPSRCLCAIDLPRNIPEQKTRRLFALLCVKVLLRLSSIPIVMQMLQCWMCLMLPVPRVSSPEGFDF